MKKNQKVNHTTGCSNSKCRGICVKQDQAVQAKKRNQELLEFLNKAKGLDKDNHIFITGDHQKGKSQYAFNFRLNPSDFKSDFKQYEEMKISALEKKYQDQHGHHWETLGRLLGMAYSDGDEAFFALLEGLNTGRRNQSEGRRSLVGPIP